MTDFDDDLLTGLVDGYRHDTMPMITPSGTEAVYRTVRRRRRTRTASLVAAVALAVLAPAATYGYAQGQHPPGPPAASTGVTGVTGSPSAGPSAADLRTPGPTVTTTAPAPAQDAPSSVSNATFSVPTWTNAATSGCPSGPVTFHGGASQNLTLTPYGRADLDGDGGKESLVLVRCRTAESGPSQVLALTAPNGTLHTLGKVFASTEDAADVLAVTPTGSGAVEVKVADIMLCCATPEAYQITQVRTFAWSGGTFRQTGGPTTFTADPAHAKVTVTAGTVTVGAPVNGVRSGTLTLTVHNAGPHAATQVTVLVALSDMSSAPASSATGSGSRSRSPASPDPLRLVPVVRHRDR